MTGQDIMLNDFGSGAFGLVLVDGMDDENTAKLKKEIEGVDHVKNVLWYDSFADLKIPKSMLPKDVYNAFNKDGSTIMMVIFDDTSSGDGTMSAIENIRTLTKHQCKVSGISAVVTDTKSLVESENGNICYYRSYNFNNSSFNTYGLMVDTFVLYAKYRNGYCL
jgi:hypothetical protein